MEKVHVGVKVVPARKRDAFQSLPDVVQQSWDPSNGEQPEVGEFATYTLEVKDAQEFKRWAESEVSNVRYVEPEQVVSKMGEKQEVVGTYDAPMPPEPASLRYIKLNSLLAGGLDGSGVLVIGSDTGCGNAVRQHMGDLFRPGTNFSGGDPADTTDRDGHGSGTGWMARPPGAAYTPHKVLGDDGSGGSAGIVKSFYAAGDLAQRLGTPVVYNASWGSDVTDRYYGPYKDGLDYATSRGVVFVFSAGNDNTYGLGSPSNFSRINPMVLSSIAFDKQTDLRASFSNYHEDGTLSAPGVQEVGYDEQGQVVRWNGTSFSAPWTTFAIAALSTRDKGAELSKVVATMKKCGRDTGEPQAEEGGGVLDAELTADKILPKPAPPPGDDDLPKFSAYSFYRNYAKLKSTECWIYGSRKDLKSGVIDGRYVPKR